MLQVTRKFGTLKIPSRLFSSCQKEVKVDCYFDTISPYSWPAFEVLGRYRDRWNLDICWKPVFMGGLVTAAGNQYLETMGGCPNKGKYMYEDLEHRTARYFDIPLKVKEDPITHIGIIGSLAQQRYITAVQQECPEKFEAVCREIWKRSWGPEDATVHSEEDLRIVSKRGKLSGEETEACLARAKEVDVKLKLKELTDEAVERGAFGAPSLFFSPDGGREEMLWGSDRFDMMAFLLDKEWSGPNPL